MMKLIAWSFLQSALGVGGIAMLTRALHGRPMEFRTMMSAALTPEAVIGAILLLGSFLVMSLILSFARMSVYIPVNTGLTFLLTVVLTLVTDDARLSMPMIVGMVLILVGISIVGR